MSIVINGIKMPEAPDEMIELAILGDGTVIQTAESWRDPEGGICYCTVTTPEKFGNAVSVPEHGRLKSALCIAEMSLTHLNLRESLRSMEF